MANGTEQRKNGNGKRLDLKTIFTILAFLTPVILTLFTWYFTTQANTKEISKLSQEKLDAIEFKYHVESQNRINQDLQKSIDELKVELKKANEINTKISIQLARLKK